MNRNVQQKVFLSIVVPVYNEEKTLKRIYTKIVKNAEKIKLKSAKKFDQIFEIILIDDGSTDSSSNLVKTLTKKHKSTTAYFHQKNQGKGAALRTGFSKAKGKYILIQDADLEYDPKYFQKLINAVLKKNTSVVYGSRLKNLPLNLKNVRNIRLPLHFVANKILSRFTSLLYHTNITDMETGYKLINSSVLKKLNLVSHGFEIEVELTAKLLMSGETIREIPITTKPRDYDEGKKITTIDGIKAVLLLIHYRVTRFGYGLFGVAILAFLLRFWNFYHRYGLWSDQARDALVGRVALKNLTPPLIGSFSSAGPFTFGPIHYYFSMLTNFIFPNHLGYWIGMGLLSTLMVITLTILAKKIGGTFLGVVTGVFAAISLTQIESSLGSTQHSLVPIFITFMMYFMYQFSQAKKTIHLTLTLLFLSLAINAHYQALYLVPMLILFLISTKPSLKQTFLSFGIFVIPWVPMIIFDLKHQMWNLTELIDYYRFGQYRIYVPNRWLTYAGQFWPEFWARTVGGFQSTAYVIMALIGFFFLYQLFRLKLPKIIFVYGTGFLAAIVWFRYFRAVRTYGYVAFSQPLIFLFTAWMVDRLKQKDTLLGLASFMIISLGSYVVVWNNSSYSNPRAEIDHMITDLNQNFGNSKLAIYDQSFTTSGCSISLSLILDDQNRVSSLGYPIGVCQKGACPPKHPLITASNTGGYTCNIVDLGGFRSTTFQQEDWVLVTPEEVHKMTVDWWKTEPKLQQN